MQEHRSLEQLERKVWNDIDFPTGLIERCHKYRKIPVKDLSIEQLRTLIGQDIGIEFLLPRVLDILKSDILAEGDLYPGDLLAAVLGISEWPNDEIRLSFKKIIQQKADYIKGVSSGNEHRKLFEEIKRFVTF